MFSVYRPRWINILCTYLNNKIKCYYFELFRHFMFLFLLHQFILLLLKHIRGKSETHAAFLKESVFLMMPNICQKWRNVCLNSTNKNGGELMSEYFYYYWYLYLLFRLNLLFSANLGFQRCQSLYGNCEVFFINKFVDGNVHCILWWLG